MTRVSVSPSSTSTQTRRALLAGAAAAPALALPVVALAASDGPDPHPAWFVEWRGLCDRYNGPDSDAEEGGPEWARILELEGLAATTPTRTLAGALAQLRFARAFVDAYGSLGSGVNDEEMLDGALSTLDRLAVELAHV